MKIYVAGKIQNYPQVRYYQNLFIAAGHEITFDWTEDLDNKDITWNKNTLAMKCYEGVASADLLVVHYAHDLKGAYVEVGIAIASLIPVWLLHFPQGVTVFEHMPMVERVSNNKLDYRIQTLEEWFKTWQ